MAAFSRKHYQIIAAAIAAQRPCASLDNESAHMVLDRLTDNLAGMFADDNPRFDAVRFAKAAGAALHYTPGVREVVANALANALDGLPPLTPGMLTYLENRTRRPA